MALTIPFAQPSDLDARWRPLSLAEESRAAVLLKDASQILLDEDHHGVFAELVDPAPLSVVRVVCAMVKRAMQGPVDMDGVTQVQQGNGPFTRGMTFANPSGDLYLTNAERRALGLTRQRASSVDLLS